MINNARQGGANQNPHTPQEKKVGGFGKKQMHRRYIALYPGAENASLYTVFSFNVYFLIEVQLRCNIVLISAVQQSDPVTHTHMHSFLIFFSIMVYHRILDTVLYSRTLFIYLMYNSLYLLTPTFHSIPPSTPHPQQQQSLFSLSLSLFGVSQIGSFVSYFIFYLWLHLWHVGVHGPGIKPMPQQQPQPPQ